MKKGEYNLAYNKYHNSYYEYSNYLGGDILEKNKLCKAVEHNLDNTINSYLTYISSSHINPRQDFILRLKRAIKSKDLYALRFLLFLTEKLDLEDLSDEFVQVIKIFEIDKELNNLELSVIEWIIEYWLEFDNHMVIDSLKHIYFIKPTNYLSLHIKSLTLLSSIATKEAVEVITMYLNHPEEYIREEAEECLKYI
ncbi:hypothetical protein [Flammeovirga sp. SJP92]|uniref:hypothetical protein n=1 Tax=Flammeovirga sp. SJP92 TaxID=1775430 RepID=UPI00078681F5|nr:hypothetical protein [Flammeovirga sp. SJP92]KXX69167.1 hypothetical protein AVL50_16710 [Flammeovirga sp. SJP92]